MKKGKKTCFIAIVTALFMSTGSIPRVFAEDVSNHPLRMAGNYICFEEQENRVVPVLKQGVITIEDGQIIDITEDVKTADDVLRLDDSCVIFPGLLDLHSHVEYGFFQLWQSEENQVPWDNRFEWRSAASTKRDLLDKFLQISKQWENPLEKTKDALLGDLIEYFAELQAAASGTTVIQGYNQTEAYDTADSHEKVRIIRDTCSAQDLGVEPGKEMTSVLELYKPDAVLTADDPATYLPPIDTANWQAIEAVHTETEKTYLEELLAAIENKKAAGYLIHMAEGRPGATLEEMDPFVDLEFSQFQDAIETGISDGRFTPEDVRNAHIGLIHACGVNLSDEAVYRFIKDCGIALIWSPVSNLMLYGDTPTFYDYLADEGILVGIGSDWSPSGSKSVWDECKFAYAYMQAHAKNPAHAKEELLKACTYTPARIMGNPRVGNITPGGFADLFILRGEEPIQGNLDKALDLFIGADDRAVEGVVVGGKTVYGEMDFLLSYEGEDNLFSYGTYENEALSGKYFLLPAVFDGLTFEEAYQIYGDVLKEADIEMSRLRRQEDPFYQSFMAALQEKYCQ